MHITKCFTEMPVQRLKRIEKVHSKPRQKENNDTEERGLSTKGT